MFGIGGMRQKKGKAVKVEDAAKSAPNKEEPKVEPTTAGANCKFVCDNLLINQ